MLRKPDSNRMAIALRQQGLSYNEILERGVGVSHSTISRWCHQIELTETQKRRLLEKKHQTSLISSLIARATESRVSADKWAEEQVGKLRRLFDGEKLLPLIGVVLYWAEGAKITDNKKSKSLFKYPHGMCRVLIHDVDMARKVASLTDKFLEEFYKDEEDYIVPVAQLD